MAKGSRAKVLQRYVGSRRQKPDSQNLPRRLHFPRFAWTDACRLRSVRWLRRLGDRDIRTIHHGHFGDDRRGNRVSGKMRFHGYHRQELFGVAPSGRHVWWIGMPIFTFEGQKVRDLYVLGDIYGLIDRLKGSLTSHSAGKPLRCGET